MESFKIEDLPQIVAILSKKVTLLERHIKRKDESVSLLKCGSTLNKTDLAQLFYILMDEDILFFDTADRPGNRKKFQLFLEEHFSYCSDAGLQTPIITISKEFSEAKGFTYKDKQLRFLAKIITILQNRQRKVCNQ